MGAERFYEFDDFRLDVSRRLLLRRGEPVALPSKTFDVLAELVRGRGELVTKDALLERVWPDTVVEEKNLTVAVSTLRKALGETPQDHRFIVTESGRGYRFVADVVPVTADEPDAGDAVEREPEAASPEPAAESAGSTIGRPFWRSRAALVVTALVAVGALAGIYVAVTGLRGPAVAGDVDSIAVLPFRPLTPDSRDEALEVGLADTLITRLSHLRRLTVRPIGAVSRFAATDRDAVAIGRELDVEAVLEGTIQRIGDRIRVNARLVRVADGKPLWAGKLDEAMTDLFAVQDAIAERVASAVIPELNGDERARLTKRYTENAVAYEHYLRGRYFWSQRTPGALVQSVAEFECAVAADAAFAPAYAGLADAYHALVYWEEYPPTTYMPMAKQAAEKALELDPSLAEAHTSLAVVLEDFEWRFAEADREYRTAIALNPNYEFAHRRYGQLLMEQGRFEAARAEFDRALEIDPLSIDLHMSMSGMWYFARKYDLAVDELRRTIEIAPEYAESYGLLGVVYREKGLDAEAVDMWLRRVEPEKQQVLRAAFDQHGMEGFLRADINMTRKSMKPGRTTPIFLAMEYAYLGEKDDAFAILEAACAERHSWLGELKVEPAWDNLRGDPRFDDLVRRVGL